MFSHKLSYVLFIIGITIGLMACATYHPKPLSSDQVAANFEARKLDDHGLKKFMEVNLQNEVSPWPPESLDFNMLTLVAFYYHPDMDLARAKWGVAKAGIITAKARPNPTLQIGPEFSMNPGKGISPWVLGFNLDVPIETAGKRKYRIAKATNQSEVARFKIAVAAWQVRSHLREELLDSYAAGQAQSILKTEQALQEENVKLVERRYKSGEISLLGLNQARISLGETNISFYKAQKQNTDAHTRLADALGLPVSALDGLGINFDFLQLPSAKELLPGEVRRQALLNRADILGALAEYSASESALQLEIAKQYPDIHIAPGYLYDQGQNKWTVGLSITLPIFNRNQGPIAEAEARRKEAEARFIALQAHVIGEIDQALEAYQSILQELKASDLLLETQKKQKQFVESMSQSGEVKRVARLNTQLELDRATLSHLDTFISAEQSLGLLEDAIQRPLEASAEFPVNPELNPRPEDGQ